MKIASQRLSFSSPPNLCALRALCGKSSAPLESQTYKPLLPQLPCFHIHAKCPGVTPLRPPLATLASSHVSPLCRKSHPFNRLPALILSCRSFSHSLPLFSMACGLFCKTPGVGIPPHSRHACIFLSATWTRPAHPTIIASRLSRLRFQV